MRRDRLPNITLNGRHTGALLAHPCPCPNPRCTTIGEHLLDSTRNMTPGPRAQAFEPRTITHHTPPNDDSDPRPDPTATLDTTYRRLLNNYDRAALALTAFIGAHRPDRHAPTPDPAGDDEWCRNHLETIGVCEPRHRGDLCRSCYDVQLAHGTPPDRLLLQAIRDRGRITPATLTDFIARTRPARRRKKAG